MLTPVRPAWGSHGAEGPAVPAPAPRLPSDGPQTFLGSGCRLFIGSGMRPLPLSRPTSPGSGPCWPGPSETPGQPGTGVRAGTTAWGPGEMPALSCQGAQSSPCSSLPPSAQVPCGHRDGGWAESELPCTPGPSGSARGPGGAQASGSLRACRPCPVWLWLRSLQSVSPSWGGGCPPDLSGELVCSATWGWLRRWLSLPLCPLPAFPAHRQALRNAGLEGRGRDLTSPLGPRVNVLPSQHDAVVEATGPGFSSWACQSAAV